MKIIHLPVIDDDSNTPLIKYSLVPGSSTIDWLISDWWELFSISSVARSMNFNPLENVWFFPLNTQLNIGEFRIFLASKTEYLPHKQHTNTLMGELKQIFTHRLKYVRIAWQTYYTTETFSREKRCSECEPFYIRYMGIMNTCKEPFIRTE